MSFANWQHTILPGFLVVALAVAQVGCGSNGESSAATHANCTGCHDVSQLQGAHSVHVYGQSYSDGFACTECHADRLGSHEDLPLSVSFDSLAERTDRILDDTLAEFRTDAINAAHYDTSTKTCSSVYCHGATIDGSTDSKTTSAWDSGTSLTGCDGCHASPPSLKGYHPNASQNCTNCHSGTTTATDDTATYSIVRDGGLHVNGKADHEAGTSLHLAYWTPPALGQHALMDYTTCLPCHSYKNRCDACLDCHGSTMGISCTE